MYYNIDLVANGITVRKGLTTNYEDTIFVFLTMEDALTWIKQDSASKP